jgi:hypothetical protein
MICVLFFTKEPGFGCMEPDTTSSRIDIIANLYRDTEHDNTIMTDQNIPFYWLCEKLLRLKMYWVVLHIVVVSDLFKLSLNSYAPKI